ncbi:MAG: RNA polymerase sigma factor [Agathobacter sp.]
MTIQELEQIIELYGKSIYSFCLQLTRNSVTADDLYQETWLIACRNIKKITYSKNVKSYLLSVA